MFCLQIPKVAEIVLDLTAILLECVTSANTIKFAFLRNVLIVVFCLAHQKEELYNSSQTHRLTGELFYISVR